VQYSERSKTLIQSPKVFVLDTSVLLSEGAKALRNYGQDEVVIPLVVIEELESKRNEPIIGRFARDVLRTLEELNIKSGGKINTGVVVNEPEGIVRTEINHIKDITWLPDFYKSDRRNDTRIITVAGNLFKEGQDVTIVSKDLSLRLKANVILPELKTAAYENKETISGSYIGVKELMVDQETITRFHSDKTIASPVKKTSEDPSNTGVVLRPYGNESHSSIGVQDSKGIIRKIQEKKQVFGVTARSAGQKLAVEYLTNKDIEIVSLGGKAGTGKTLLAVSAGLEQVMESHDFKKIKVFRPLYAVGGQELGYLPGTEEEKMDPWAAAIFDSIEANGSRIIDEIKDRKILEVVPVTNIRGRSFNDSFIVVDEAQNFDTVTLLTILSRVGQNSKIVFSWDGAQKDNHLIGRNDGIVSLVDMLKQEPSFAHVSLMKSERSKVAEIASNILEQYLG
jgi:PhoH-like ATPase